MSWDSEHFDPLPPASVEPPPQQQKHWLKRLLAPFTGMALLIWKVAGPLLFAVKNVKLFAFSATFLVSLAAYTSIWGWRFALGFMLLLMVHEMGHVIQLRREGVPASAPMFIPFMGAFVGMKEMPKNAWAEAKVGLAGPVLGAVGGVGIRVEGTHGDPGVGAPLVVCRHRVMLDMQEPRLPRPPPSSTRVSGEPVLPSLQRSRICVRGSVRENLPAAAAVLRGPRRKSPQDA
jgi:hypothetical protein